MKWRLPSFLRWSPPAGQLQRGETINIDVRSTHYFCHRLWTMKVKVWKWKCESESKSVKVKSGPPTISVIDSEQIFLSSSNLQTNSNFVLSFLLSMHCNGKIWSQKVNRKYIWHLSQVPPLLSSEIGVTPICRRARIFPG